MKLQITIMLVFMTLVSGCQSGCLQHCQYLITGVGDLRIVTNRKKFQERIQRDEKKNDFFYSIIGYAYSVVVFL